MNELTLDGKTYVSSRRAAEITGYAKDYVGQLCREGHVEARLVGRNWYVLESSIREHRFGKPAENLATNIEPVPAWNQAKYTTEEPAELPQLSPEASIASNTVSPSREEVTRPGGAILTDMESAWREWFTKRDEISGEGESEAVPEEVVEERIEEEIAQDEIVEDAYMRKEEGAEEQVPVTHLDLPRQEAILDLSTQAYEEPVEEDQEPVIIEERIVTRPRRRTLLGNMTIKSLFIGLALISVALAAVGTGFAQRIVGTNLYRLPEINFIAGVNEINK
ncbi:MAG TPA: hypothetical protein VHC20_04185 [Candidatus Paceibacterota bacterium]|nr:hypothetical protein [Candidatus Paceibacterota bacterium]